MAGVWWGEERDSHHREKHTASAVKDEMEDLCVQTDRRVEEYEERKIEKFSPYCFCEIILFCCEIRNKVIA